MQGLLEYNKNPLIWKWSLLDLRTDKWKLLLAARWKRTYENTLFELDDVYEDIMKVDISNKPDEAISLVQEYICNNIWGLWIVWNLKDC
jgi:hypothetical protein